MSLPYFPMYPTDFEADTSHLTLAEDGAYNRLLRLMWMTPTCSLPDDAKWIKRRMRCTDAEFQDVVLIVIDEFFTRKAGRIISPRLAKEYQKTDLAHKKRVAAGSKGGKAKRANYNDKSRSNAKAKPKQPEPEPEPYKKEDTTVSLSLDMPDDTQTAFDLFNELAGDVGLPVARVLSKKRKASLKARLAEAGGIEGWRAAMDKVRASPLCTGNNNRGWVADLDFLLQQSSFTKLMEGSYDARNPSHNATKGNGGIGSGTARAAAAVAQRLVNGERSSLGDDF